MAVLRASVYEDEQEVEGMTWMDQAGFSSCYAMSFYYALHLTDCIMYDEHYLALA